MIAKHRKYGRDTDKAAEAGFAEDETLASIGGPANGEEKLKMTSK